MTAASGADLAARLARAGALLAETRDVVEQRVADPAPPAWCRARGWDAFLLALDDEVVTRCEEEGLDRTLPELAGAPASLAALGAAVRDATAWAHEAAPPAAVRELRRASQRKRGQVAALVERCRALGPRRVIDVGAGVGHLTRELARALAVPTVGIERDPDRVATARELTPAGGPEFVAGEVGADLALEPGDLVVGLHACGALGDAAVVAAARDGVALALVCCCLQKVPGAGRAPLSAAGAAAGLTLSREVLGLTNLVPRSQGVEGPIRAAVAGRAVRYGLRLLLAEAGHPVGPGEEMRGLHRRHVGQGLAALAERAFARRDLPPPGAATVADAEQRAGRDYARIRRLSLPRAMLGRLLEQAVVLDRACALAEAGLAADVEVPYPLALSPRNLAVVARPV